MTTRIPRVIETPSGKVEIFAGVWVTVDWEVEPDVTERLIYTNDASEPSVILRRPSPDSATS